MRIVDKQILDGLINELRTAVQAEGMGKVVLGLSGGIDSALSATLAVEALGKENVFPYSMPYEASSESSRTDARLMADYLGLTLETVELTAMAKAYPGFAKLTPHRLGNILARLRMMVLFDKSAEKGALVLGSSNKSEILLGYTTWYGDSACSINPLGDLYKTQVYQAAELLGIPGPLIEKAPSADLKPGQTDEGDLGYPYAKIDEFFDILIEKASYKRYSEEELRACFGQAFLESVQGRVSRNAYKRAPVKVLTIGQTKI